jgi:Zn-dependent protease
MCQAGVLVNIGLGVFNLLPVPPLDGSNLLAGVLPPQWARWYLQNSTYGFIVLIVLLLSGAVQHVIVPVIYGLGSLLVPM